jgi:hypothetical protein
VLEIRPALLYSKQNPCPAKELFPSFEENEGKWIFWRTLSLFIKLEKRNVRQCERWKYEFAMQTLKVEQSIETNPRR